MNTAARGGGEAGAASVYASPPLGVCTPEYLEAVAALARELGVQRLKLTAAGAVRLHGLDAARKDEAKARLEALARGMTGQEPGPGKVQVACCSAGFHGSDAVEGLGCDNAKADALALARQLDDALRRAGSALPDKLPAKVRVGVSGCPRCCAESRVRDVGLVAGPRGWTVLAGGNAGARPRAADELARHLDADAAVALARDFLVLYAREATGRERTARFMERVGIEHVKHALELE